MIETVILKKTLEAEGICSFELAAADGSPLPPFEPGAHIDVEPRAGVRRQYSLCAESTQAGRYLIAVLRESASRGGSAAMHELRVGDRLRVGVPRNLFPLVSNAQRHLLMAGGIGITPLLAMAEHLALANRNYRLHYCARSAARMAFSERIRSGPAAKHACLHLDDGAADQTMDLDRDLGTPEPGAHVYVCGPAGFMEWVLSGARARGWPEDQLHREYFAAAPTTQVERDAAFNVQIGYNGPIYSIPAGVSVVEALATHGLDIPVSCEQGVCGTCLTRILDGQPDHRDSFLTEAERSLNDRFTPCCSRARTQRLVLDL